MQDCMGAKGYVTDIGAFLTKEVFLKSLKDALFEKAKDYPKDALKDKLKEMLIGVLPEAEVPIQAAKLVGGAFTLPVGIMDSPFSSAPWMPDQLMVKPYAIYPFMWSLFTCALKHGVNVAELQSTLPTSPPPPPPKAASSPVGAIVGGVLAAILAVAGAIAVILLLKPVPAVNVATGLPSPFPQTMLSGTYDTYACESGQPCESGTMTLPSDGSGFQGASAIVQLYEDGVQNCALAQTAGKGITCTPSVVNYSPNGGDGFRWSLVEAVPPSDLQYVTPVTVTLYVYQQ
jgi:hypothetical protein